MNAVKIDLGSRSHIQTLVLMGATAVGLYLCYRLALPFLTALAWALALAVVFTPFQRWIESKVKHPNLAALISVLGIGLVVLGLATFVGQRLVQEATNGAELIKTKVESGEWRHALEAQPRLVPLADWVERQNLPGTVKTVATWMTTTGASFVKGSVVEVIGLVLTFYLLFFFGHLRWRGRSRADHMLLLCALPAIAIDWLSMDTFALGHPWLLLVLLQGEARKQYSDSSFQQCTNSSLVKEGRRKSHRSIVETR